MNSLVDRCGIEFRALWNVFHYHENNNDVEKFIIFVLIITWSVITIGIAFEHAELTPAYSMMTALLWALVGRIWGGEVKDLTSSQD